MSLFIIDLMGLFFYNKIGSIISIGDLPTTNIIEPFFMFKSHDMINITILLQNIFLIEFSDNLGYNTFNLNKKE